MKEILNKINNDWDFIDFEGDKIKFKEIAKFKSLNFVYGVTPIGWVIIHDKKIKIIEWDMSDFRDFLLLLELDFDEFESSFLLKNYSFEIIFPINEIFKMIIESESNYWGELFTFLLLKKGMKDSVFFEDLKKSKIKNWMSQKFKHNLIKLSKDRD